MSDDFPLASEQMIKNPMLVKIYPSLSEKNRILAVNFASPIELPENEEKLGIKKYFYWAKSFSENSRGIYIDITLSTIKQNTFSGLLQQYKIPLIKLPRDCQKDYFFKTFKDIYFIPVSFVLEWESNDKIIGICSDVLKFLSNIEENTIYNIYNEVGSCWIPVYKIYQHFA